MCIPSRALILSGSYASRTGIWHNQLNVRPDGKNPQEYARHHPTIPPLLKAAGYRTALAGKAHAIGTGSAGPTTHRRTGGIYRQKGEVPGLDQPC
jgi:arylsulfatase A-like enzyme